MLEEIMDVVLFLLNSYFLIAIAIAWKTSKDFRAPFFTMFLISGLYGSISVVGYIVVLRFRYSEEQAWIYKSFYAANVFGITGSTVGRGFICYHQFLVVRSASSLRWPWSRRFFIGLSACQLGFSCARAIYIPTCSTTINNATSSIEYLDKICISFDKSVNSLMYLCYLLSSVVFTALTFVNLRKLVYSMEAQSKKKLIQQQRIMSYCTAGCTVSVLPKAAHQTMWAVITIFGLDEFSNTLQKTYVYSNYVSNYGPAVALLLFSPRVRSIVMSPLKRVLQRANVLPTTSTTLNTVF